MGRKGQGSGARGSEAGGWRLEGGGGRLEVGGWGRFPSCLSCASCLPRPSCLSRPSRPTCLSRPSEQFSRRTHGTFGLPERGAAIVTKRIERADVGERHHFVASKTRV